MERMKYSHIEFEKKIKQLESDNAWEKDQNIKGKYKFEYMINIILGLQQNLGVAEAKIEELSSLITAEKHFNRKVADNLALQTRESSKLKSVDAMNSEEIIHLRKELEDKTQVFIQILNFK